MFLLWSSHLLLSWLSCGYHTCYRHVFLVDNAPVTFPRQLSLGSHTPILGNCHLAVTHLYLTIVTWQSHTHTPVLDNCHLAVTRLYLTIVIWQSHACPWQLSLGNHTPVFVILHLSLAVAIWQSSQMSLTVSKPVLDTHYICPWQLPLGNDHNCHC